MRENETLNEQDPDKSIAHRTLLLFRIMNIELTTKRRLVYFKKNAWKQVDVATCCLFYFWQLIRGLLKNRTRSVWTLPHLKNRNVVDAWYASLSTGTPIDYKWLWKDISDVLLVFGIN
jgi:hypothetical protein